MPNRPERRQPPPEHLTDEQRQEFTDHVTANPGCGHIAALRAIGITGTNGQLHDLIDRDRLKNVAQRELASLLFQALWEHGVTGMTRPVYSASGKYAGDTVEYSPRDRALLARIVGLDPGTRLQHGNIDGEPFQLGFAFDPSLLSDQELEQLRQLLKTAQPEGEDGAAGSSLPR